MFFPLRIIMTHLSFVVQRSFRAREMGREIGAPFLHFLPSLVSSSSSNHKSKDSPSSLPSLQSLSSLQQQQPSLSSSYYSSLFFLFLLIFASSSCLGLPWLIIHPIFSSSRHRCKLYILFFSHGLKVSYVSSSPHPYVTHLRHVWRIEERVALSAWYEYTRTTSSHFCPIMPHIFREMDGASEDF